MKKIFISALVALSSCAGSQAHAELQCGSTEDMFTILSNKFEEAPVAFGSLPSGQLVMWANYETQTFSVTITDNEGVTCLMTSGENFTQVEDLPPIKPNL